MSRSIIALRVFHLSERTVMKPYLICLGATAIATLDLPDEVSKVQAREISERVWQIVNVLAHRQSGR